MPIIALPPLVEVQRRLGLSWGVSSRLCRKVETTDEMIEEAEARLLGDGSVLQHPETQKLAKDNAKMIEEIREGRHDRAHRSAA